MARAISVTELYKKKFNEMHFEGKWQEFIGNPELIGSWIIWGGSGNGKTRFTMQLCKYLAKFERVAYNSLEEGLSKSVQTAFRATNMYEVKNRVILLDAEPMEELIARLKKHKSPNIIVIDSIQYSGMSYNDYKNLRSQFPRKLFILISHADGKNPAGRVAKSIRYDAFVKILVEGYRAFPISRFGGGKPYTIWEEGAKEYYDE